MEKLEYRVGELQIQTDKIHEVCSPFRHKFIVNYNSRSKPHEVSIYVSNIRRSFMLPELFYLERRNIVGGGDVYIDDSKRLVLGNYLADFYGIPKESAENFGRLMVPDLQARGIDIEGFLAETNPDMIHEFWFDFMRNITLNEGGE